MKTKYISEKNAKAILDKVLKENNIVISESDGDDIYSVNELMEAIFCYFAGSGSLEDTIEKFDPDEVDSVTIEDLVDDGSISDYNNATENPASISNFEEAQKKFKNLISNVKWYKGDDGWYLELSDNYTLFDIDNDAVDNDFYFLSAADAIDSLEEDIGTKVYCWGRMGRHICIEANYNNILHYDEYKKAQEKVEKDLIDYLNSYSPEDDGLDEKANDIEIETTV